MSTAASDPAVSTLKPAAAPEVDLPLGHSAGFIRPLIRSIPRHWIILALLTLLGGILRFAWMTHPSLWGDEAMTFSRVTGDFRDLLDVLQTDGFVPLHYELYWAVGQKWYLTPFIMRLIPALAGILMVPAMYFLARQLVDKRAALLTAAFTACSAYMLNYSRDAKMYMLFWLFCALNAGCLLWWLRSSRRAAWLAWIASGLAMVGLHPTGPILLGIEVIFLIVRRKFRWKNILLFLIGAAIIGAGPIGYFKGFNQWNHLVEKLGWKNASGLNWVAHQNAGRDGVDMVRFVATAHLYSWEWPRVRDAANVHDDVLIAGKTMFFLLLFFFILGMLPWSAALRGRGRGREPELIRADPPPEPWWRTSFYLGAWMVLPVYIFYLLSTHDYTAVNHWRNDRPRMWIDALGSFFNWTTTLPGGTVLPWWAAVLEPMVLIAVAAAQFRRRFIPALLAAIPLLALILLILAVRQAGMDRLEIAFDLWLTNLIGMGLVLLPPIAFVYCGEDWPTRFKKLGQFVMVVGGIYLLCMGAHKVLMMRNPQEAEQYGSIWQPRYMGFIWPALAIAVCALLLRLPTWPLRWGAIILLLSVNLAQYGARMLYSEPPVDIMASDLYHASKSGEKRGSIPIPPPAMPVPAEGPSATMSDATICRL